MRKYKSDLHIHSCLSPCAGEEMTPRNIVREAKHCGLDIIGICDHNSCENVPYVMRSAAREGIWVSGGIEVTTREEVHILAYFEDEEKLFAMQAFIYENLPGTNDENYFGSQFVVNEKDEIIATNRRLLIGATDLPIGSVVELIHSLNGLAIASHIDREGFGILGQLGFVPADLDLNGFEVSSKDKIDSYQDTYKPLVTFSDAHHLKDIGRSCTDFIMADVNLEEMSKALCGIDGRRVNA
ncbi:MAG: PHP domain-containing protein [Candidatus Marinimicrobia bacterium]|nr:PHP domain-containing protein [Candidatus Neomarinimicrobiota bacterium]